MVVVGVDRRRREAGAAACTVSRSSPSSTVAPSLRSSVAIAAIRSVSLTRQLPMPVSVVASRANNAIMASVIAASGMAVQSSVPPESPCRPVRLDPVRPEADGRRRGAPARRRTPRRPGSNRVRPPSRAPDRRRARRPRGNTTRTTRRPRRAGRRGSCSARRPARRRSAVGRGDRDAEAAHQARRYLDVRPRDQRRRDPDRRRRRRAPCASGNAISSADRYWLDTSPRIATVAAGDRARCRRSRAADSPLAEVVDRRRRSRAATSTRSPIGRSRIRAHAVEHVVAAEHREHRGQRPERGARVAERESAPALRQLAAPLLRPRSASRRVAFDAHAEHVERVEHPVGVVGVEHVVDRRRAFRERREQQRCDC